MSPGDTVSLAYDLTGTADATTRDWFPLLGPPGSELSPPARALRGGDESPPVPTAFALRQNQPKPFSGRTTIRFDLPVATSVELDVFDAQGRRVRSLASGRFPAGFHHVDWDQRDQAGRPLGAGVYLYRIRAGEFRDQKNMVLLAR